LYFLSALPADLPAGRQGYRRKLSFQNKRYYTHRTGKHQERIFMALDYQQQKELNAKLQQTGQNVLERVIVMGAEVVKFVFNFIADMFKQLLGR
jgi:hypothetical protein